VWLASVWLASLRLESVTTADGRFRGIAHMN
jgi:hypothetical protein